MLAQTELALQRDFKWRENSKADFRCPKANPRILVLPEYQLFHSHPFTLLFSLFGNAVPYRGNAAGNGSTHWIYTNASSSLSQGCNPEHVPAQHTWLTPWASFTGAEGRNGKGCSDHGSLLHQHFNWLTWLLFNDFGTSPAHITYWSHHLILSPSRCSV